jgi:hypothetical protein
MTVLSGLRSHATVSVAARASWTPPQGMKQRRTQVACETEASNLRVYCGSHFGVAFIFDASGGEDVPATASRLRTPETRLPSRYPTARASTRIWLAAESVGRNLHPTAQARWGPRRTASGDPRIREHADRSRRGRLASGEFRLRRAAACSAGRRCRHLSTTRRRPIASAKPSCGSYERAKLPGLPDVGRVRKAALTAKPESGRRDSSRRLPTTRSGCLNQRRRLVPRDGCGTEEADSRGGCDRVGATAAFPAAAPAADVRQAWQSNGDGPAKVHATSK